MGAESVGALGALFGALMITITVVAVVILIKSRALAINAHGIHVLLSGEENDSTSWSVGGLLSLAWTMIVNYVFIYLVLGGILFGAGGSIAAAFSRPATDLDGISALSPRSLWRGNRTYGIAAGITIGVFAGIAAGALVALITIGPRSGRIISDAIEIGVALAVVLASIISVSLAKPLAARLAFL